jgi:hypothetical protein
MYGPEVNTDEEQRQAGDMRRSQSHDGALIWAHMSWMGLHSQWGAEYVAWTALEDAARTLDQNRANMKSLPGQCLLLCAPWTEQNTGRSERRKRDWNWKGLLVYADGVKLLSENINATMKNTEALLNVCKEVGLEANAEQMK